MDRLLSNIPGRKETNKVNIGKQIELINPSCIYCIIYEILLNQRMSMYVNRWIDSMNNRYIFLPEA